MAKKPAQPKTETAPEVAPVTLEQVIEATKAGSFVYTSPEFHAPLVAQGLVEINTTDVPPDANGNIATRAVIKEESQMTTTETAKPAAAKPVFEIEENVAIPARVRASGGNRAGRAPVYPFDGLQINQSFFVPDPTDKKAAKTMASTVAGANARYSEVVEGQTRVNRKGATVSVTKPTRKFTIYDTERTITVDGQSVVQKGARIFRVALA